MDERRQRIVNSKGALDSMRNLGITLVEGVTELVDNSIDASASNIHVHIHKVGEHLRIIVADDGVDSEQDPDRPHLKYGSACLAFWWKDPSYQSSFSDWSIWIWALANCNLFDHTQHCVFQE